MLTNLLQLTRVETGLVPTREWVPAEELVGAALTRLEGALGHQQVVLDVERDLILSIDPVLFEQVLINLLENALRHGKAPFAISACTAREGGIVIEVGDSGPGLPADTTRLFEKFFRASSSPGVGLGLAVVRAIVQAHEGTVVGENRPGGGAMFRISLPSVVPPLSMTRPSAPEVRA